MGRIPIKLSDAPVEDVEAVFVDGKRVMHIDLPGVTPRREQHPSLRQPFEVSLSWPNELGETPSDALNKHVVMDGPGARGEYSVEAFSGDALFLRPFP